MHPFADNLLLDSAYTVEYNCSLATINWTEIMNAKNIPSNYQCICCSILQQTLGLQAMPNATICPKPSLGKT